MSLVRNPDGKREHEMKIKRKKGRCIKYCCLARAHINTQHTGVYAVRARGGSALACFVAMVVDLYCGGSGDDDGVGVYRAERRRFFVCTEKYSNSNDKLLHVFVLLCFITYNMSYKLYDIMLLCTTVPASSQKFIPIPRQLSDKNATSLYTWSICMCTLTREIFFFFNYLII